VDILKSEISTKQFSDLVMDLKYFCLTVYLPPIKLSGTI